MNLRQIAVFKVLILSLLLCSLHSIHLYAHAGGNFIRYPAPPHPNVSLPVLPLMNTTNTQGGSGRNWLYTINTRQALISSTQNISQSRHGTVAFSIIGLVLKVSTSNGVHYYWQVLEYSTQPRYSMLV